MVDHSGKEPLLRPGPKRSIPPPGSWLAARSVGLCVGLVEMVVGPAWPSSVQAPRPLSLSPRGPCPCPWPSGGAAERRLGAPPLDHQHGSERNSREPCDQSDHTGNMWPSRQLAKHLASLRSLSGLCLCLFLCPFLWGLFPFRAAAPANTEARKLANRSPLSRQGSLANGYRRGGCRKTFGQREVGGLEQQTGVAAI